ncbi:alpha/beta hydrolase [Clavibacter sp. MX14-G9D]|uniref:alpha/beta hydrolase n=1 Tax=Clavibacter sp. MX14-G9D TaxID=3064656 RepID=UPI00293E8D22|nr:alpha/beta hydrolase [Clavibacter sp. MX14-G9D]
MPDEERSTGGADHRTIVDAEGVTLHYYVWEAERPRAVVHIAHGVGEHALRYARLAQDLNAMGYTVAADDHRGHGATGLGHLGIGVLGPRRHLAALDGIQLVSERLRRDLPDLPLVLLGHSWGALLAQRIVARASHLYAGLVLSGASLAMPGVINTGDLNKRWRHPAATGFEWLSRDPEAQRAFGADDRNFDVNALKPYRMRDSVQIMGRPPRRLATDLPVLIQGGEEDSLGGRRGMQLLARDYSRRSGLSDVLLIVYPGARHEIYNETNRDEVVADLRSWLDSRVAAAGGGAAEDSDGEGDGADDAAVERGDADGGTPA